MAQVSDEVFKLAQEADDLASQGKLTGLKAGHLMQSRFSILFAPYMTEQLKIEALQTLIALGYREYRKCLK